MPRIGKPSLALCATISSGAGMGVVVGGYWSHNRPAQVIGLGMIALGSVLFWLHLTIQFIEHRRSAKFGKDLLKGDDVSDKFREGWEIFAKGRGGKDPYFLPWYLMVGEPASGKTTAIQHSEIGFIASYMGDTKKGVGGTYLMDWFFTKKAILLDTAGALLMEERQAEEFEKLLEKIHQNRPKTPINGVILAIPTDKLQTDSDEKILEKATRIAKQLRVIRRKLAVRFPVYIIITKADRISGFQEFFGKIDKLFPSLLNQVLGWSNPAPLDEEFKPSEVESNLATISSSIRARRLRILYTDDAAELTGDRIDLMDALYALPEQLGQIGSRLRIYLDNVFEPDGYSDNDAQLFLRGVYFTSSIQEGLPLDLDLARKFDIKPDAVPQTARVKQTDKACFLHDLFEEKIFQEKGLVTSSRHVDKGLRTRNVQLMVAGFAAVSVVLAFTVYGNMQMEASINGPYKFWSAIAGGNGSLDWLGKAPPQTPLSQLNVKYGNAATLADLYAANLDLAQKRFTTPPIFYIARKLSNVGVDAGNLFRSHQFVFEQGEVRPVLLGAWAWLLEQQPLNGEMSWAWDVPIGGKRLAKQEEMARNALDQLIALDVNPPTDDHPAPPPDALLAVTGVAPDSKWARTFDDSWQYFIARNGLSSDAVFPPSIDSQRMGECLNRMVEFDQSAQASLTDLAKSIAAFDRQESDLLESLKQQIKTPYEQENPGIPTDSPLRGAVDNLRKAANAINPKPLVTRRSLVQQFNELSENQIADGTALSDLGRTAGSRQEFLAVLGRIAFQPGELNFNLENLQNWDQNIGGEDWTNPDFLGRVKSYDFLLRAFQNPISLDRLRVGDVEGIRKALQEIRDVGDLPGEFTDSPRGQDAKATCLQTLDYIKKTQASDVWHAVLKQKLTPPVTAVPPTEADFQSYKAFVDNWDAQRQLLDNQVADPVELQNELNRAEADLSATIGTVVMSWIDPASLQVSLPDNPMNIDPDKVSRELKAKGSPVLTLLNYVQNAPAAKWVQFTPDVEESVQGAIKSISDGLQDINRYGAAGGNFLVEWNNLGADPLQARQNLAAARADQIKILGDPFAGLGRGHFVSDQWDKTIKKSVYEHFREEFQKAADTEMANLRRVRAFPLDPSKAMVMTNADLDRCQKSIEKLLINSQPNAWVSDIACIKQGDQDELTQTAKRIAYLKSEPQLEVSLADGQDPNAPAEVGVTFSQLVRDCPAMQFRPDGQQRNISPGVKQTVAVAGKMEAVFLDGQGKILRAGSWPEKWGVLKLVTVTEPNKVKQSSADSSVWYVRIDAADSDDATKTYPVWLKVKFVAAPDFSQWTAF